MSSDASDAPMQVIKLRHLWTWAASVLVVLVATSVAWSVATNPAFQWPVVAQYLFDGQILAGPWGPLLYSASTNDVITPLTAALAGLGLSQAAYTAEVIRAGILSVAPGQTRAAKALGMRPAMIFVRIVFPQAMRVIIPPVGNEVISMVKGTSLVSVIAMADLLYTAQLIYARTCETIPLLIVASLWYLAIVSVLSVGQYGLERHYGRGA